MRQLAAPGHAMDVGRMIAEESETLRKQEKKIAREIRQAEVYREQQRQEK